MSSLFGSAAANTNTQGGGLFGNTGQKAGQQASGGSLFGSSLFGANTNTAPQTGGSSLFGGTTARQTPAPSLFGGSTAVATPQPQQASSFFGGAQAGNAPAQQQPGGLFGASNVGATQQSASQQPQLGLSSLFTRSGGLFGASNNQPAAGTSLFGQSAGATLQNAPGQGTQNDPLFEKLQTSRIWTETEPIPPQKNVQHQINTCARKWNPYNPDSPFQTYLYNNVGADAAPFYRPGQDENEQKWEDALAKVPSEGCIPIPIRGFQELGKRIVNQTQYFHVLQCRLHEINNGLSELLRRHDLEISARAAECRRRHVRLSQKCLSLATKTQILRNRGYALDAAEEELAQKLRKLERSVLDPALGGREEEIWARMVSLRERGRILASEFAKTGGAAGGNAEGAIDEETLKRAKKILEDYDSQLTHLSKELENITMDYDEWAKGRTA